MLERLTIRDLAVIERAEIVLGAGLNAVTGETGAGKSLLVQAVSLLVGEKGDAGVIRSSRSVSRVILVATASGRCASAIRFRISCASGFSPSPSSS
jgi:DNA repair ATPase RecN